MGELDELRALDASDDPLGLIAGVRELVRSDRRALTDPWLKAWCGRRWRNLFLAAAGDDPEAVKAATARLAVPGTDLSLRTGDRRPARRRIAERFLKYPTDEDWATDLPPAQIPDEIRATLVLCPGLINSMLPRRAFERAFPALAAERGWRILAADAHPVRGCEANIADLRAAIERGEGLDHDCRPTGAQSKPPGDVFLICYSKGAPDAFTMLVRHPELAERVKAIYLWGGAVGGSYLADSIYDAIADVEVPLGPLGDGFNTVLRTVCPLVRLDGVSERLDEYDLKAAIRDLTTSERERFLDAHAGTIDATDVPIFNLSAATTALGVPFFQAQGYLDIRRAGRDPNNDMQLTQAQSRMTTPMATDLAVLRAHHWDIAYDPFPFHLRLGSANLDHPFPRRAAITAIVELTAELGLIE